ncbi:right-handed parallel beta-helix repeat-containing protein [Nitrogeniibacter mangrovi]|uniref:Right-handed parallel beta-helix repeat-containing protein n=1 Tax=Nitrogeniibacter mangrovi TaxID=2016596 RepID=A0A6C1B217_9RHOO|nr:DUF6519 domain-containing protein [Nitrogeniibacter mangrovi]QID17607.1 right-handed parallel beta-helix repeat-containing protein [Nitrogeniibacter mangrovi]
MSFDLSRIRFDARRDFLGVVMQQGRVQLDADWNEWVAQLARRIQAGTVDTFNGSVVPRTTPDGFHIDAAGGALTIGPGRMYVDGLLAENHGGAPDAWDPTLAELAGTTALDYTAQPYLPDPPAVPQSGRHLVYVDVWQRDITAVEDPALVEPAVGVDSTGRLQTVWQVKLLEDVGDISCATADADIPGWQAATAPSAARLSTGTATPSFEPDPCRIAPAAGYRGLENQLYRVEVHTGGALGTATFKWSRDNASVASRVTHIDSARTTITVESIGRDEVLSFHAGDWVEVTDDWRELHGQPGELRRISPSQGVDPVARTLTFEAPLTAGLFPTDGQDATDALRNTRVRRWDQAGEIHQEDGTVVADLNALGATGEIEIPPAGTRLFLEDGIVVEFTLAEANGAFHSGDYWVVAARTTDASVEILDAAPPLGIHHHYARLAVVDLPDGETDCRTLWPPIADGGGCDCTVCVSAEDHNNGTHTLQQAIDGIKDSGGTVCLGIGSYAIDTPLNIHDGRSLRIRGQGWATILQARQTGGLVDIADTSGIALQNLTLIGSGSNSGFTPMIAARTTVDLRCEHINVLGFAVGDGTSLGIGLSGSVLGVSVSDCAIVAERGIGALATEGANYTLTGELRIRRNLFFCSQSAVHFGDTSLHYGTTQVGGNLMLNGNRSAIVATGAVLPGSAFDIRDNTLYTTGDGIQAGVDGLTIEGNEIAGLGERSGDGIALVEGLDPVAIDTVRIRANRLRNLQGNAIRQTQAVGSALIQDNQIDAIGLGVFVMSEAASIATLTLSSNQCLDIGQAVTGGNDAYAAIQLTRVQRGDVRGNTLGRVARNATAAPAVDAIRAVGVDALSVDGNRLFGIGPDRSAGPVTAIRVRPPFDRLAIDDNQVDRRADAGQNLVPADWQAIRITRPALGGVAHLGFATAFEAAETSYLLTLNRLVALPVARPDLSIRGNRLRGELLGERLGECANVDHLLFADNACEMSGGGKAPLIGQFAARTLTASNNRLIAPGDADTLHLHPGQQRAIVMGNTSTGNIRVPGGAPVPADPLLTNIIGT